MNLLGFDIGGTSIRAVVLQAQFDPATDSAPDTTADSLAEGDLNHAIHDTQIICQRHQPRPDSPEELLERLAEMTDECANQLRNQSRTDPSPPFAAVGVGCAGFLTHEGDIIQSPNIPGIAGFPFLAKLRDKLGCPVVLENDAAAAGWAENVLGTGRGCSDLVFLTFGTGIGGALIQNNKLVRGTHGFGSEPGHMTIVPDGRNCPCGRKGCWEQYASGNALGRYARQMAKAGQAPALLEFGAENIHGKHVSMLLEAQDPVADVLLAKLGEWIAIGVNNIVTLTDPQVVVLGGGLSNMGEPFLFAVKDSYEKLFASKTETRPQLTFALARYKETAGAVGAAFLAATHIQHSQI